jgi:nitrite reductase/ring-hydroxylating ferredoxin subunit/DMSO/TMAO reductase YedYZ heme-binding membrane subunit
MSTTYRPISWNPYKVRYDSVLSALVAGFLATFLVCETRLRPELTIETLLLRAFGSAAFVLLHVILCLGPLARFDARFLPLLYNRRHLGVTMFILALAHGVLAVVQFHSGGTLNPLVSLLAGAPHDLTVARFPFQAFGFGALLILFAMAATSHDFWLRNLTPRVWKTLHMGVYAAYGLLVGHVLFGVMQGETEAWVAVMMAIGAATVCGLHLAAARRERRGDVDRTPTAVDGFVDVCNVDDIPDRRAVTTCLAGERVAIFRYDGKLSAISNVCQHQNGPLGEGQVIGDCVVCPWHGYEYSPASGAAPAPFTEKVPTFNLRVVDGRVKVDPRPNAPGTHIEPVSLYTCEPVNP